MGDDTDLKSAINQCADCLPPLINQVDARLDDALAANQTDLALKLRDQLRQLSDALSAILNRRLVEIDSSPQMQKAIAGFAGINKTITSQLKQLQTLQSFVDALNALVGPLNTAVGVAFNKPAAGAPQGAAASPGGSPSPGAAADFAGMMAVEDVIDLGTRKPPTNGLSPKKRFVQPAAPRPHVPGYGRGCWAPSCWRRRSR